MSLLQHTHGAGGTSGFGTNQVITAKCKFDQAVRLTKIGFWGDAAIGVAMAPRIFDAVTGAVLLAESGFPALTTYTAGWNVVTLPASFDVPADAERYIGWFSGPAAGHNPMDQGVVNSGGPSTHTEVVDSITFTYLDGGAYTNGTGSGDPATYTSLSHITAAEPGLYLEFTLLAGPRMIV